MLLQRFVFAIAMVYLGPGPDGARSASLPGHCGPHRAAVVWTSPSSLIPTSTSHAGLSRQAPWRHRIKSVLEDRVAWCFQPVPLGPAEVPDPVEPWIGPPLNGIRPGALIPLRC